MTTLKEKLVQELRNNEHIVQIIPWDVLVMEWEHRKGIVKTAAGYVAPTFDMVKASELLREFGLMGRMILKRYPNGKSYIIFKGYPGARTLFKGTTYTPMHTNVVRMVVGPKGISKSVQGGFVLTMVLYAGIEVVDYFLSDNQSLHNFLGKTTSDLIKVLVASTTGLLAGLLAGTAKILVGNITVPVLAVIVFGMATGSLLNKIDGQIGATRALIDVYEQLGIAMNQTVGSIAATVENINLEIARRQRWLINRAMVGAFRY